MLNLPPLYPVTEARLAARLSEQIRRLGSAGFPLVQFRGEPLDGKVQWEELKTALVAARENGGWPAICIQDRPDLARQALQEGLCPWGLHLPRADALPAARRDLQGLAIGVSTHEIGEWISLDPLCDHVGIGPLRTREACVEPLDLARLRQGCVLLRAKGITPFAMDGLAMEDAGSCYQAGAESLVLGREIASSLDPSALLWRAQCLRWRFRPPFRRGQGVALIGGSGCGKSSLARALGRRLQVPVKDLDEVIARRAGKSIPSIFSEDGEPVFRDLETEVTCEAFRSTAVLALGGGAWESPAIRDAARASGFAVFWIAEDPARIWRRVALDPARPLAQERETFLARWRARMPRWMEAPMILPLGRNPGQLSAALQEHAVS